MSVLDLSYFDRNHFIVFPKPPLRPASSQDVKYGIIVSGVETSLWEDFIERLDDEFDGDYDPDEEKLCVYFHNGPRIDQGIWNRVWALTDDGRPLELAKLDVALIPISHAPSTRVSDVSSLSDVSQFLSDLTSDPPPSEASHLSTRDQCHVLPRFLTEITPNESVSQISSSEPSIPSDQVSLISRAEKDVLQWKAGQLDVITRELRAIQIGSKPGLSTATIRDILGELPSKTRTTGAAQGDSDTDTETEIVQSTSFLGITASTGIPVILCLALVTLSLRGSAAGTAVFPPIRHLHRLLTSSSTSVPSSATVIYRVAKPVGLSPHNLTFLVPFLVVGSAVVGWNVLCKELGIEFSDVWGKGSFIGQMIHGVEEWDVDWDGVREFFGMVEG